MADRPTFSALAAASIWLVALIGSWVMVTAIVAAVCPVAELSDEGGRGSILEWAILGAGAMVPVLVMVALAPRPRRHWFIAGALVVAAGEFSIWTFYFGDCLA